MGVMINIFGPFSPSVLGLLGGILCIVTYILVRARRKRQEAEMEDWEDQEQ